MVDGAEASSSSSSSVEPVLCGIVDDGHPLPRRLLLSAAACAGAPWLHGASRQHAARSLAAWTREGGAARALLVLSVGSVTLVALNVLLIPVFFLVSATTIAILFSILMSLVAVGGLLAVLLAFLALMYVGIMSVAIFFIATTTGWVALFWIMWFSAKKCMDLAKCY